MKFKCQVGGLISAVKPMHAVATKGIMKDYPTSNLITFVADDSLSIIADGGYVSGCNTVTASANNMDYECVVNGTVTVNANDLFSAMASFLPNEMIDVELHAINDGAELILRSQTDVDEMQTLPTLTNSCSFGKAVSKKDVKASIKMNKQHFIHYANKVSFAHGDQQQFKQFKFWLLRSFNNNSLRFVAGTGQIFAVVDLEGKNISSCDHEASIMFPNEQTPVMLSVLNESKNDTISLEMHENFVYVDANTIKLKISNLDPSIKWPDENKFLQRNSTLSFTTKVGNWKTAVKGINATNNDEFRKQNKVHHCSLSIDLNKKIIQAKTTDSTLKSNRKVAIEDIGTNEEIKEMNVRCVSSYFNDIVSKASDEENLQFELTDASSPIVVRYYADSVVGDYRNFKKADDNGTSERYSVFFALAKP